MAITAPAQAQGWELVFSDEFEGSQLDNSKWTPRYWFGNTNAGNAEKQYYDNDNFEFGNGIMRIVAKQERVTQEGVGTFDYTSGLISSYDKQAFDRGYMEIRAKMPSGKGLWPAFWTLPSDKSWPPEIDVFEVLGHDTSRVYTTLHYDNGGHQSNGSNHVTGTDFAQGFNTFAAKWEPGQIIWYVNDQEVSRVTGSQVPTKPMYLIANLAVGGTWPGSPDANTKFPSSLDIDHIRVWQNSGGTLYGGTGSDTLTREQGQLNGLEGNDILTIRSKGTVTGGSGSDRFILGSGSTTYASSSGATDYVLIKDFNTTQDVIQLSGSSDRYVLGNAPVSGTGIYLDQDSNRAQSSTDELIAVVQGASALSLGASYFNYISTAIPTPPPPPLPAPLPNPTPSFTTTIEAENMTMLGYVKEGYGSASGGNLAKLSGDTGSVSAKFVGVSGNYTLNLNYIDENDGVATFTVKVNGTVVSTFKGDRSTSGWNASTKSVGPLKITSGQTVTVEGVKGSGELARLDKISVTPSLSITPPNSTPTFTKTIEAENMTMLGYVKEGYGSASGGNLAKLSGDTGSVSAKFVGASGNYTLNLNYIDENDGVATFTVKVNGTVVSTFKGDRSTSGWNASTKSVGPLKITYGQTVTVTGVKGSGELARLDKITLSPITTTSLTPVTKAAATGRTQTTTVTSSHTITGTDKSDRLFGTVADDVIVGKGGNDRLKGNDGNDELLAGSGNDSLLGGKGNDRLVSDYGRNLLTGGNGADMFIIGANAGRTIVRDFELGVDKLTILGELSFSDLMISSLNHKNTLISNTGRGEIVVLQGVSSSSLSAADFGSIVAT